MKKIKIDESIKKLDEIYTDIIEEILQYPAYTSSNKKLAEINTDIYNATIKLKQLIYFD